MVKEFETFQQDGNEEGPKPSLINLEEVASAREEDLAMKWHQLRGGGINLEEVASAREEDLAMKCNQASALQARKIRSRKVLATNPLHTSLQVQPYIVGTSVIF